LIRALEPAWLALVVVFGLYMALGLFVPIPTLPTKFSLPILICQIVGLWVTLQVVRLDGCNLEDWLGEIGKGVGRGGLEPPTSALDRAERCASDQY
jgi:hypothetical protein